MTDSANFRKTYLGTDGCAYRGGIDNASAYRLELRPLPKKKRFVIEVDESVKPEDVRAFVLGETRFPKNGEQYGFDNGKILYASHDYTAARYPIATPLTIKEI